jgi:hypothetical protein
LLHPKIASSRFLGGGAYLPDLTASQFRIPYSYSPWILTCSFYTIRPYNAIKTVLVLILL